MVLLSSQSRLKPFCTLPTGFSRRRTCLRQLVNNLCKDCEGPAANRTCDQSRCISPAVRSKKMQRRQSRKTRNASVPRALWVLVLHAQAISAHHIASTSVGFAGSSDGSAVNSEAISEVRCWPKRADRGTPLSLLGRDRFQADSRHQLPRRPQDAGEPT